MDKVQVAVGNRKKERKGLLGLLLGCVGWLEFWIMMIQL